MLQEMIEGKVTLLILMGCVAMCVFDQQPAVQHAGEWGSCSDM
jgi:hypothetical protein